jgi:hypothetical protein
MTYIADLNTTFAIYPTEASAERAVRTLFDNGFSGGNIQVLLPKNESTRQFAQRMQTAIPAGVADAPTADLPLDGTGGFLDMFHEPRQGALPTALRDMGVPADWCDLRVVGGKTLVAVKCDTWDQFFRAIGILEYSSASDVYWALSPDNYRKAAV